MNLSFKKYRIIFSFISLFFVMTGVACSIHGQDNTFEKIGNEADQKKILLKLVHENGITKELSEFSKYIDTGEVEYFDAMDQYGNSFIAFFLTYPVRGMGDRSFSFTFRKDKKLMIWSKDTIISINGGLFDCNGDGYLEKIIKFVEDDTNKYSRVFPDRIQIYSLKSKNAELLLDVRYNLIASPGDKSYLLLYVTPGGVGHPSTITLKELSEGSMQIKFIYSSTKFVYHAVGERTKNWEIIYPVPPSTGGNCP